METQNTNQNQAPQSDVSQQSPDLLQKASESLDIHFKAASNVKSVYNFLIVLAILFVASALWSEYSENSIQFTFVIVAALYVVFIFGKVFIKENDKRLKNADTLSTMVKVLKVKIQEVNEELASYKQAFQNSKLVVKEWEQAHSYLKAENSNLKENYSKLQDSYDTINGRCNIAEKNVARYKKDIEDSENIIKKAKSEAYIQGIAEYEELVTLKRSIPQTKDEEARRVKEARRDALEARIDLARARSAEVSS